MNRKELTSLVDQVQDLERKISAACPAQSEVLDGTELSWFLTGRREDGRYRMLVNGGARSDVDALSLAYLDRYVEIRRQLEAWQASEVDWPLALDEVKQEPAEQPVDVMAESAPVVRA